MKPDQSMSAGVEAAENYINGNNTIFRNWLKKATKLQMLDCFEHLCGYGNMPVHQVVAMFRKYLS